MCIDVLNLYFNLRITVSVCEQHCNCAKPHHTNYSIFKTVFFKKFKK